MNGRFRGWVWFFPPALNGIRIVRSIEWVGRVFAGRPHVVMFSAFDVVNPLAMYAEESPGALLKLRR
jgi:hypothetical protein